MYLLCELCVSKTKSLVNEMKRLHTLGLASVKVCVFVLTVAECSGDSVRNVPDDLFCFPTQPSASNHFSHPTHIHHLKGY